MEKCEIYRPAGGRLQARTLGSRLSAGETHLSPFSRRLNTCDNARQRRSTLTFSDASTGCRVSTIERHCVELINGNLRDRRRGSILEPAVFSIQSLSLSTFFRRWNFRRRILEKKDEERRDRIAMKWETENGGGN